MRCITGTCFILKKMPEMSSIKMFVSNSLFIRVLLYLLLFLPQIISCLGQNDSFCVGSFNLRNYLICDRLVDGKFLKNYPKPEEEKKALYNAIKSINPTVLCIQEIGSEAFVKELINDLKQYDCNMPYYSILQAHDSSRMTAILSKVAFKEVFAEKDISFNYFGKKEFVKRGLLGVKVDVNNRPLYIYVVHLKSKLDRPNDKLSIIFRRSEAAAIATFLKDKHNDFDKIPIVLAGDFNDTKASGALKSFAKIGFIFPKCEDSRQEAWTYYFKREDSYVRSDFILINKAAKESFFDKTCVVDLQDWYKASDHRLIYSIVK